MSGHGRRRSARGNAITIEQLARHLSVSKGTVSRALNGYSDVAQATQKRVAEAADRLGYCPSSMARQLARGVVETVGFVLPARDGHVTDPFLSELIDGIAGELAAHQWDLIVAAVPEDRDEIAVAERLVRAGKVGGFVLTRTRRDDPRVAHLKAAGIPFVVHGRTRDPGGYAWLDIDNEKAMIDAVRHMHDLGHRDIAFLGGDPDFNFAYLRRCGYLAAMAEVGCAVRDGYLVDGLIHSDAAARAMAGLLALPLAPTAVVCNTDALALGAIQAIWNAGLRPGADISVMGYDGLPIGSAANPALTTMSQSSHAAGRQVARMIRALVEGEPLENSQVLWEARLTRRASTNPPAARPEKARRE